MVRFTRGKGSVWGEAVNTVHTSGINVESIAVILGGFAGVLSVVLAWQIRRDKKHDTEMVDLRKDITTSVDHLSEVLLAKLETKDNVSQINARLSRIEGMMSNAEHRSA